jgi:hypothetical protein
LTGVETALPFPLPLVDVVGRFPALGGLGASGRDGGGVPTGKATALPFPLSLLEGSSPAMRRFLTLDVLILHVPSGGGVPTGAPLREDTPGGMYVSPNMACSDNVKDKWVGAGEGVGVFLPFPLSAVGEAPL